MTTKQSFAARAARAGVGAKTLQSALRSSVAQATDQVLVTILSDAVTPIPSVDDPVGDIVALA